VKKSVDPIDEVRGIKRKLSRELEGARRKGRYLEKLREYDRETRKAFRIRRKAHSR
jgi:hypothetical protein